MNTPEQSQIIRDLQNKVVDDVARVMSTTLDLAMDVAGVAGAINLQLRTMQYCLTGAAMLSYGPLACSKSDPDELMANEDYRDTIMLLCLLAASTRSKSHDTVADAFAEAQDWFTKLTGRKPPEFGCGDKALGR